MYVMIKSRGGSSAPRARVRGADLAVELREQVGVGLAVQLAPVDELPRARETEERGDVEVYQCQFAVVKQSTMRGLGPRTPRTPAAGRDARGVSGSSGRGTCA